MSDVKTSLPSLSVSEPPALTTRSPGHVSRVPHGKEEWQERARWNPTPEEFQAYLAREIELAKALLKLFLEDYTPTSLFTSHTIECARAELRAEREKDDGS
jgi:hypothetical protein